METPNLIVIKTLLDLKPLIDGLKENDFIAYDTETDGTEKESRIIGASFAWSTDFAYYVIFYEWSVEEQKLKPLETLKAAKELILLLKGKNLIMQNAPFDCFMTVNNFGVELIDDVHTDTLILGHLLNENRPNGLKERGVELFGESAKKEQDAMKASVSKNGGVLTKEKYELYKADADLIAYYGAKDAILTLKVFYHDIEDLYNQKLEDLFYNHCMPQLRGPTYSLNTVGLKVDMNRLEALKGELEAECHEAKAFIYDEITPLVKHEYPGTNKNNIFNINSTKQIAWLLFEVLGNEFLTLTDSGRDICKALNLKLPYSAKAKRDFIESVRINYDRVYDPGGKKTKTGKESKPKKIGHPWIYLKADKAALQKYSDKYKWAKKLLEFKQNEKLLTTYVEGIKERSRYGIIRPSFLQHGTPSERYASRNPNFQNLPRKDKRVKSCIVARPGKVFVGADQSQLEARVFASFSQDPRLLECFASGEDFYSVIGATTYSIPQCSLIKDEKDPNCFAVKYANLRDSSKVFALAAVYGTTAPKMAPALGRSIQETQELLDDYFERFPGVKNFMLKAHKEIVEKGVVYSLHGRPRRIPKAKLIPQIYGDAEHSDLPYEARQMLNLAVNFQVQCTASAIMNKAAIRICKIVKELSELDHRWSEVKIVLQVHDELILEAPEALAEDVAKVLKECMENTTSLPGVALEANPKIANNLADLK